jgi:hypothetical protein
MLAILICAVALSGCSTCPKGTNPMQAEYVIETQEPDVVVEVMLDGKLIFSGKTFREAHGNVAAFTFTARPGDHHISIAGSGHEPWQNDITLVGGSNKFWTQLKTK